MHAFLKTGKTTVSDKTQAGTSGAGAPNAERRKPPAPWVEK